MVSRPVIMTPISGSSDAGSLRLRADVAQGLSSQAGPTPGLVGAGIALGWSLHREGLQQPQAACTELFPFALARAVEMVALLAIPTGDFSQRAWRGQQAHCSWRQQTQDCLHVHAHASARPHVGLMMQLDSSA